MSDAAPISDSLVTPEFRGSYCNLVKPRTIEEGKEPEYSLIVTLKKGDPETKKFILKLHAAMAAVYLAKMGKLPKDVTQLKHYPIADGDKDEKTDDWAGYWLIRAKNKRKPGAIDQHGNKLFSEEELYSGAWYRASIAPWAWNNPKFGAGVSIDLRNVFKIRDDEKFSGSNEKPEDAFGEFMGKSEGADPEDDPLFK